MKQHKMYQKMNMRKNLISTLKIKSYHLMISKIENSEGLKNADEICKFSDAIMIDRGDLSAEIGEYNLYEAILKISNLTKKYGKPLIMATENLETMSKSNNPTKNDIISLGFSNQINSDVIMLSEETAISNKWRKIIIWLNKFLILKQKKLLIENDENIFWKTVDIVKDYTLVVFTKKGLMLDKVFKKISFYNLILISLYSSFVFFLTTNPIHLLFSSSSLNYNSLMSTYRDGLPFFAYTLCATLAYNFFFLTLIAIFRVKSNIATKSAN